MLTLTLIFSFVVSKQLLLSLSEHDLYHIHSRYSCATLAMTRLSAVMFLLSEWHLHSHIMKFSCSLTLSVNPTEQVVCQIYIIYKFILGGGRRQQLVP